MGGYSELVKQKVLGEINLEQENALGKILEQSMDLLTMINGLLHVTTIEAEAVRVEYAEINLYKLLEDLRANYDLPSGKDLSLNWDYPSDLPSMRTDGEKLKAVIQNLISNAIKFTEKGGVTVYVRHVPEADMFELKVTDTGIEIPKEKVQSIFDMFEQVDSSATRRYGGVGLGLYIAKKFTEILGGGVDVKRSWVGDPRSWYVCLWVLRRVTRILSVLTTALFCEKAGVRKA